MAANLGGEGTLLKSRHKIGAHSITIIKIKSLVVAVNLVYELIARWHHNICIYTTSSYV